MEIGGVGVLGHEVVEEYRGDEGPLGYAHPHPTEAGASQLELAVSLSPSEEGRHQPDLVVAEIGLENALKETLMGDGVKGLREVKGHDGCPGWRFMLVRMALPSVYSIHV